MLKGKHGITFLAAMKRLQSGLAIYTYFNNDFLRIIATSRTGGDAVLFYQIADGGVWGSTQFSGGKAVSIQTLMSCRIYSECEDVVEQQFCRIEIGAAMRRFRDGSPIWLMEKDGDMTEVVFDVETGRYKNGLSLSAVQFAHGNWYIEVQGDV